ncbi:hypothetical protein GGF32_004926 [Allomyces javanicus]|nr:hypothetical protein GGF32_004926 [Allomyces javanicus]
MLPRTVSSGGGFPDSPPSTRPASAAAAAIRAASDQRTQYGGSASPAAAVAAAAAAAAATNGGAAAPAVAKPNFGLSGKLAQEQLKTASGAVLKAAEPADAHVPREGDVKYALLVFKGSECLDTIYVSSQSRYLIGRDRSVVDLPVDHPSCSKQHAVLQYRIVPDRDGGPSQVKAYLMDLESTNGTLLNDVIKLEPARFYELRAKDKIRFGQSTREFVLMEAPQ